MADAVRRSPTLYGGRYNEDGTPKPLPTMTNFGRKVSFPKEIPKEELEKLPKDGWKPEEKDPKLTVKTAEIKPSRRKVDLSIWPLPDRHDKRAYNRAWMHNFRVRQRLKLLNKKYGDTAPL